MRATATVPRRAFCHYTSARTVSETVMSNLLILTEVQESMRARYKQLLLERFPQLTINVVGHHNLVDLPSLGKDVLVTNIRGIHGAPVSEATIAFMLSLARDMPRTVHGQDRSAWDRFPAQLLAGKTVGILGVGLIAEYLAPICKTFGMTVVGITGSPREAKGFDRMAARSDLLKIAPELDFLVVLIPMSADTRNIINA